MSLIHKIEQALIDIGATDILIRQSGAGGGRVAVHYTLNGEPHWRIVRVPGNRKVTDGPRPPQE